MNADYLVHDRKFQEARANGWDGWGGNVRIAHGHIWMERLFSVKQIPTSGHILELGCGEGNYTRRLAQRGYHVTGVDISQTAIDWAKEKLADTPEYVDKITYLVHDLTQPNILPNQSFDLVVDGNCLHCIIGADRRVFLQNVYRLLVDGGIFFISTICSSTDENTVVEFEGRPYRTVHTQQTINEELEATGFSVLKSVLHPGVSKPHKHCTIHAMK